MFSQSLMDACEFERHCNVSRFLSSNVMIDSSESESGETITVASSDSYVSICSLVSEMRDEIDLTHNAFS